MQISLNMLLKSTYIVILISLTTPLLSNCKLSPIIILPGLAGSQLQAKLDISKPAHLICDKKSDWFTIWLNFEELVPYAVDCFLQNTELYYNASAYEYFNATGVQIRVPEFGSTLALEYLDSENYLVKYFYTLIESLVQFGYKRGYSLMGAPYDWRLGPKSLKRIGFFSNLTRLIQSTYVKNDNTAVTLICHSLGCPTILDYLNTQVNPSWKKEYVHSLISLAGAWGGSIKTISGPISGNDFFNGLISPIKLRDNQRSLESTYLLFPNAEVYDNNVLLVETLDGNYSISNLDELFMKIKYPLANTLRNQVKNINSGFPYPGVPVCCIHGRDVKTVAKLIYGRDFPDSQPTYEYGQGDGTVNLESLRVCTRWNNTDNFRELVVPGNEGSHETIINSEIVLAAIKEIVQL